jgi:F-type H+-transporting ATPase subunit a
MNTHTNYMISSPLEQFKIWPIVEVNSGILNISLLSITNFTLYMTVVTIIIYGLHVIAFNTDTNTLIPSRYSVAMEGIYNTVRNIVISQIGNGGQKYIPFVYTIFIVILFSNLVSIIPYNFAIMAQLVFTLSMSFSIWFGVTILGLNIHGKEWFALFVPSGCSLPLVPILVLIEFISYVARSISLGLRLGANILAGHLLVVILAGLIFDFMSISLINTFIGIVPITIVLGITMLETAICWIQAYVFAILTSSYIKDALYSH